MTQALEAGHVADMYHAGTRKYYRVQVLQELEGPFYENRPTTTFGGLAGWSGVPQPEPNYRLKCITLLAAKGGGAALNNILEEGFDGDGVDYKSLYERWSAYSVELKDIPVAQGDPGDEHV